MIKISDKVEEKVRRSQHLSHLIAEGLINLSALARTFQKDIERETMKEASIGAIIAALQRYSDKVAAQNRKGIDYIDYIGDISVRPGVTQITYTNTLEIEDKIISFLKNINSQKIHNSYLNYVKGSTQITLIFDFHLLNIVEEHFSKETHIIRNDNLSGISIKLIGQHQKVPGVIGYILNQIAWYDINLVDVVSTFGELTVFVEPKDVEKAFGAVHRMRGLTA